MPAAAVQQACPGKAAALQQLVGLVFHQQLQKEGPGPEGAEGAVAVHLVEEPLDAGKVAGAEEERLLLPEGRLPLKKEGPVVGDALFPAVVLDAAGQGGGHPAVVVEGDVPRRLPAGGGGQVGKKRLAELQQRGYRVLPRGQGRKAWDKAVP